MGMGVNPSRHNCLSPGINYCGIFSLRAGEGGDHLALSYENVFYLSINCIQRIEEISILDDHSLVRICCHQTTSLGTNRIASAGQIMLQVAHEPQTS